MSLDSGTGNAKAIHEIVNSDQPLRRLVRYYSDAPTAMQYYAKIMQNRYPGTDDVVPCEVCGNLNGCVSQVYHWKAVLKTTYDLPWYNVLLIFAGHISVHEKKQGMQFRTVHSFCEKCVWKTRLFRILGVLFKPIAICLLFVGIPFTAIAPLIYASEGSAVYDKPLFREHLLLGIFAVILGGLLFWAQGCLRVPRNLRNIGRRPFSLRKVTAA